MDVVSTKNIKKNLFAVPFVPLCLGSLACCYDSLVSSCFQYNSDKMPISQFKYISGLHDISGNNYDQGLSFYSGYNHYYSNELSGRLYRYGGFAARSVYSPIFKNPCTIYYVVHFIDNSLYTNLFEGENWATIRCSHSGGTNYVFLRFGWDVFITIPTTKAFVLTLLVNGANSAFFVNHTAAGTGTLLSTVPAAINISNGLAGFHDGGNEYFYHFSYFNIVHSSAERLQMVSWLIDRFNIVV